jgi:hypothetical protein
MQQECYCDAAKWHRLKLGTLSGRIFLKKTYQSVAAAALVLVTGVTAGFAAELPSYDATSLPISSVQLRVLGAENVREQTQVRASTITPLQRRVLTPRAKMTTATAAPVRTETVGSR